MCETKHFLVARMAPVAHSFDGQICKLGSDTHFLERVMERVGIIPRLHPAGRVHDGCQMCRPRGFEISRVETPSRRQCAVDLNQAGNNVVETEMGEDRLRDAVVEEDVEPKELESVVDQQMDLSVRQAGEFNFQPARIDERRVSVQSVIMAGCQILDELNSTAERAASHIDELMFRA